MVVRCLNGTLFKWHAAFGTSSKMIYPSLIDEDYLVARCRYNYTHYNYSHYSCLYLEYIYEGVISSNTIADLLVTRKLSGILIE